MSDEGQPPAALTIDELSQRVEMTVRNLREWRTLGLLPAAEMRGRVGYYEPAVVARVERIKELHAQGFPLDLIRRMLEASDGSADDVLRFAGALRAPFREEDAPVVDLDRWTEQWGSADPAGLRRAAELGLIRERPDGGYEYTSARVARVGDALHALGLSLEQTLAATAEIREHADGVADLFERVWLEHVWRPFLEAGASEEGLKRLEATLDAVQPLALDAVVGIFTVAMEARIEQGIAREVERAAAPPRS